MRDKISQLTKKVREGAGNIGEIFSKNPTRRFVARKNLKHKVKTAILGFSMFYGFYGCNPDEPEPNIPNSPPVASVYVSPGEGETPFTSRIKVNGTDKDGISDIKNYVLQIDELGLNVQKSKPIDTTIVFSNPGDYVVEGFVKDKKGEIGKDEKSLKVTGIPKPSVSQEVTLGDSINLYYNLRFQNIESVNLDVFKDGEKIISRDISDPGYVEIFSYVSNQNITKGNYEFVTSFKDIEGKDTSVVSNIEIPNYTPTVNWGDLDIDFDEDSSTTVSLRTPADKNPEDNPIDYIDGSFSSNKAEVEYNSKDKSLKITGLPDMFGDYTISAEFGTPEGGIGYVSKGGKINEFILPGYNPFATPNLFGQGEHLWEYASRAEKLQMLDEANRQDKSWEWEYGSNFQCSSFARAKAVNMFGCENLEKWDYYSIFENAINNNNLKIKNGSGNIPVYWIATQTDPDATPNSETSSSGHAINGTWVGPNNYVEKRDASKFDQWVFFEPQREGENGTYYVQPGDWQMDDNGDVRIYWFGDIKFEGISKPRDYQVLQYKLTNGNAELDSGFSEDGIGYGFMVDDPYNQ